MREKWPEPGAAVLVVLTAVLALVAIIVILIGSRQEEQPAMAQVATASQPTARPTAAPATSTTVDDALTENTPEIVAGGETVSTTEAATTVGEMEDFESITEFYRVGVPAGWSAEETFPGGALVMANSEAALRHFTNDQAIESGDLILNVGFLPFELFRQREVVPLDIQFDAPPDAFMRSLLPIFRVADDATLGEVELVSISPDRDAGMMTVADGEREGLILFFIAGDEVVAVVSAVALPGVLDAFRDTIFAVATEVTFGGAQGALYGALLEG